MRKLVVGLAAAALMTVPGTAFASLVNVKTNNTVHPNNTLRCSGQCDVLSDNTVEAFTD